MRKLLLLMALVTVLAPVTLGQMTATIGSTACSPSSYQLPWNHYYGYSETQYGIPASDLTALGNSPATITKIGWHNCQNPPTSNYSLNVYINQVPSAYDLGDLCTTHYANTNVVATGKLLTGAGAGTIYSLTLDTPFTYTPGNALIISVCDTTAGYQSPYPYWSGNTFSGNGFSTYSDSIVYDCNMATIEGGSTVCTNMWLTTWFEFISSATTYNLTMLTPGGAGIGTVAPAPGTYSYLEDAVITISASPYAGFLFDYWELDGAFYSNDQNDSVLMNANHTVQGFFKPFTALALPFYEDFTGVATGDIPANWDRTHTNWGVAASNMAGGVSPEMQFNWSPSVTDEIRVITPPLDGTTETQIFCSFKHYVNNYNGDYTLCVQTSIDDGASWQNRWSTPGGDLSGEVLVSLNAVAGEEFLLAIVYDGNSYNINQWYVDDIYVGAPPAMWELTMLNPVGQGAVTPSVGLHDMILGGTEITLGALPSSTWYAFDLYPNNYNPFVFDPADLGPITYIGTNDISMYGATWAAGVWYATSYNPSSLYTVNPTDGELTLVGSTGLTDVSGITYDDINDIMYASSGTNLYTINRTTGQTSLIGSFGVSTVVDIAYGDGVLYAHSISTDSIYTVNVSTGAATLLGPTGIDANFAQGMEYDKDHGRLFLALADFNYAYLAEVDKTNGSVYVWFQFDDTEEADGLAIPYGITHPWEFDHWEVDGVFYSNDPVTTLVMNNDHTVQGFFVTAGATFDLTMLTPGGTGSGAVTPVPGIYTYAEDTVVYLAATANMGSEFDYWEVNGSEYSSNPSVTLVMDDDYIVQAFFKPFQALALPFTEDFTGVSSGGIPANWDRNYTNWGVSNSSNAGGVSPEMQFSWSPSVTDEIRVITPRLDGTTETEILCSFKHYVNDFNGDYTLRLQTSINGGVTWQDRWSELGGPMSGEVLVNLNAVAGNEFLLAFVFDGDSYNINYWYIDDIYVGAPPTMWELDMLTPVGQGAVAPSVGLHDMILDGTEVMLGALPSATWYAADAYPGDDLIVFDTMNPAGFSIIAANIASDFVVGGTWADGTWYVSNYDEINSYIWTVNPVDGTMNFLGAAGEGIHGLAYDEVNDILYGTTAYELCTINRSTGAATIVGAHGSAYLMIDIAYGDGVLYGHCIATDSMYTIDVSAGTATLIGPTGYDANYAQGMEYDKDQGRLFLALYTSDGYLAEADTNTGNVAVYGSFDGHEICALTIPYDVERPWVFDRWEVDGALYSKNPLTTLMMDADYTVQAFFAPPSEISDPTNCDADPTEVCAGDDVVLTADSDFEIHWFDDACGGNEIGVGSPLTANPLVTTTYYARAYDPDADEWSDGCCDVNVTAYPLPAATASNNSTATVPLEEGETLELVGGPDSMEAYYWEGPDAWTSTDQNPTRTDLDDTMAGVYTLTVTDANGCVGATTTTVYIGEPPPIPTMGLTGLGILLLAVGSLMSFARHRK